MSVSYKSKLHQTVSQFPTDYWNDSCSMEELGYAIENGAVGATTNPNIVVNVLKKERTCGKRVSGNCLWNTPPGLKGRSLGA